MSDPLDLLAFREHLAQYQLLASGRLDAKLDELKEKLGLVQTVDQANALMKKAIQDMEQAQRAAAVAVQTAREDVEGIRKQADLALAKATTQSAEAAATLLNAQEQEANLIRRVKSIEEREAALKVQETVWENKHREFDALVAKRLAELDEIHEKHQDHARRLTQEEKALQDKLARIKAMV